MRLSDALAEETAPLLLDNADSEEQVRMLDELVETSGRLPSALAGLSSYLVACPQPSLAVVVADVRTRGAALPRAR